MVSLRPQPVGPVPEETVRIARAAFPKGTLAITMRDALGGIFDDESFATLFATRGRSAETPWRLALVTVLQFAEGLSDRQAAAAVRARIDWKYALGLDLTDPGFDASVLSEFRTRLVEGSAETHLFEALLARCRRHGLLQVGGRQRTDSTHVLAKVRALNRLEVVGETMRCALNALAVAAPDWLRAQLVPEWAERYGPRVEEYRLPSGQQERTALAETIGQDGIALLTAVYAPAAPAWLREIRAVETLRQVWVQQYTLTDGHVRWRSAMDLPPASIFISSPYDPDARYAKKRETSWVGYKVHLTETCDEDTPHLITHVETTPAPLVDSDVTATIHQDLRGTDRLPATHIVDTGYVDANLLVTSQRDFGVDLLGPTRPDAHWQARAGEGFEAGAFTIDWQAQQATCPQGRTSVSWTPARDGRKDGVVKIKFAAADCRACASREHCTQSSRSRTLTIRPQAQYLALQAARSRQTTDEFKALYACRAGVEGTLCQGVRRCHLRRARYIGFPKTRLQHLLTATALNYVRVGCWLTGNPRAKTQQAAFLRLLVPAG
jgi:transposase